MFSATRRVAGALAVAAAVSIAGGAADAQTITVGDGLIDVAVGDVNILNDVDIGVAAQVAANICGVRVGPVAVLGRAVDAGSGDRVVCVSDQGPVTLKQN